MNYLKFLTLFLLLTSVGVSAQLIGKPEKVVKKFAGAVTDGDFERASRYCILDAKADMDRMVRRRSSERVTLINKSCQTAKTEFGVDCECVSEIDGRERLMIYHMTEVDGKWKIYEIDSESIKSSSDYVYKSKKTKGKQATPHGALESFASFNLKKNYKKASDITILRAKNYFVEMSELNPGNLPVSIYEIECYDPGKSDKRECNCKQKTADGKEEFGYYELALVEGKWKIVEFGLTMGAESVVRKFVGALADGDCYEAALMAEGVARESVQGSIDAGCINYNTEVVTVSCDYNDETAKCSCTEKRDGMEMTFVYDLSMSSGRWLITNYQKDFELDTTGMESVVEMVEIPEEIDPTEYIHDFAEVEPLFPGGEAAMVNFFQTEIKYPESAIANKVSGTVFVQFVVNTDGSITDIIILKGINSEIDAEALRVVASMPRWTPGQLGGENVPVRYAVPIRFQLN